MHRSQILWLVLGVIALLCVVGWQRTDGGVGRWQLIDTRNSGIFLLNTESGKLWGSKFSVDGTITWVPLKTPVP